eukprot:CAMPEP_0180036402 /NCGR_PEP_ID=MMETSP0984-20121128/30891_1 /TAXON_ID=483367 /ORGANISM="non described non described, Strain CCMP 2436" /LENGTH=31 /DNA_ID= /DNA_START= /DNA_END= /DNA_ORIENTATION=
MGTAAPGPDPRKSGQPSHLSANTTSGSRGSA